MAVSDKASDQKPLSTVTCEELARQPYGTLAQLRERAPVVWLPAIDGWLATSRHAVLEAMRDPSRFTVDDPRFSTAQVVGPSMLSLDGAEHVRHRSPFGDRFARTVVYEQFGRWLREECGRRVAAVAAVGEAELRTELAGPVAVVTIMRFLGLTLVDETELLGWYRSIVAAVVSVTEGDRVPTSGIEAFGQLSDAIRRTAKDPAGSWLSEIRRTGSLADCELVSNTAVLLFGAIETGEGAGANVLWHVLTNPDWLARLRSEPRLIETAVEESLRLEPAASVVDRYATRATVLAGAKIAKGDLVRLSLLGANRDPDEFDDPDRFDPLRVNLNRHLTFAQGPHACLGAHLARLEANEVLRAVLKSPDGIELTDPSAPGPTGLIFRKPESVNVRWSN